MDAVAAAADAVVAIVKLQVPGNLFGVVFFCGGEIEFSSTSHDLNNSGNITNA